MSVIKVVTKLLILGGCFYLLLLFSNYYSLDNNLFIFFSFIISAVFSLLWSVVPTFKKSKHFKLSRDLEIIFQTLESFYEKHVDNLKTQNLRRARGGFTDPRLRKQYKFDNNEYLNQIVKLQNHINRLESISVSLPNSNGFRLMKKNGMYVKELNELLVNLNVNTELRKSDGKEIISIKDNVNEIISQIVKELSFALEKLYKSVYTTNLKKDYGIIIPAVPKNLSYIKEEVLKELNKFSTTQYYNLEQKRKQM